MFFDPCTKQNIASLREPWEVTPQVSVISADFCGIIFQNLTRLCLDSSIAKYLNISVVGRPAQTLHKGRRYREQISILRRIYSIFTQKYFLYFFKCFKQSKMTNMFASHKNVFQVNFKAKKTNIEKYKEIVFVKRGLISSIKLFYQTETSEKNIK